WTLSGAQRSTGSFPHSGTGYLILGAANNANHTAFQQITIPSGTSPNLNFWLNVTSNETTTTTKFDSLFVEVRSTSGTLLATLATFSNLDKGTAGVYALRGPNSLASFAGQTVRLQFRATTNQNRTTTFRVDDVSVKENHCSINVRSPRFQPRGLRTLFLLPWRIPYLQISAVIGAEVTPLSIA